MFGQRKLELGQWEAQVTPNLRESKSPKIVTVSLYVHVVTCVVYETTSF